MRTETGLALLTTTPCLTAPPGGLPLSSLVARVAAARGLSVVAGSGAASSDTQTWPGPRAASQVGPHLLALTHSAPGLVTAPATHRRLAVADVSSPSTSRCALLGVHGGAGVSALLRAGLAAAGANDAMRCWPRDGSVLLVARTSTSGLEWARDAARQHSSGAAGLATELVGLVLIADAPGRLPGRVEAFADLVCGGFARIWQVPWLEEWRLAAATEALPVHPEVARLITDLRGLTTASAPTERAAL